MCTRFAFSNGDLFDEFGAERVPDWPGSYNVAPTDRTLVVMCADGERIFHPMRWGLIPIWAKDASIGIRCLNARVETVFEKNAFRDAVLRRRCLVPADGFYEWKSIDGVKQPFFIHHPGGHALAMAGIWERWRGPDGQIESFSVLTSEPNAEMAELHNRMPVVLAHEDWDRWIDPDERSAEDLIDLLVPAPDGSLVMHPVDRGVGNTRAEGPELIRPIQEQPALWDRLL